MNAPATKTLTLHAQWLARAERLKRIAAKMQARASRIHQKSVDLRHTAEMVAKPMVPVLKCYLCEAHDGEEHYSFCTTGPARRGELVS